MAVVAVDEEKWTNSGSGVGSPLPAASAVMNNEDILFCIDAGVESLVEMKLPPGSGGGGGGGPNPNPMSANPPQTQTQTQTQTHTTATGSSTNNQANPTRLESIKQAILIFIDAKLSFNPHHRFAFLSFSPSSSSSSSSSSAPASASVSWLRKEFTSDFDSAAAALRGLSASPHHHPSSSSPSLSAPADLTHVFRLAAHEANKSRAHNRILRLILIYCRSSSLPHYQWPPATHDKPFTLDVIYLHDKPGPDNCPQKVFDALVDALDHMSEYEGYIFECGQGSRLFRHMSTLLAHPQQRYPQDKLDIPKILTRKSAEPEAGPSAEEGGMAVSSDQ